MAEIILLLLHLFFIVCFFFLSFSRLDLSAGWKWLKRMYFGQRCEQWHWNDFICKLLRWQMSIKAKTIGHINNMTRANIFYDISWFCVSHATTSAEWPVILTEFGQLFGVSNSRKCCYLLSFTATYVIVVTQETTAPFKLNYVVNVKAMATMWYRFW